MIEYGGGTVTDMRKIQRRGYAKLAKGKGFSYAQASERDMSTDDTVLGRCVLVE